MNRSKDTDQQVLSFAGRSRVANPVEPWLAHPDVREAFDAVDRLQQCLDGFAVLMSRDEDVIQGKSREDVESLVLYLNEKHREAMDRARDATWIALKSPD